MNKFSNSNNLLIFVRHGERMDMAGLTPTFHACDSELTTKGKQQAFEIGVSLSEYLMRNYPDHKTIKIYSSPFARTIQTSKNLIDGISRNMEIDDTININYYFSEVAGPCNFKDPDFKSFIVLLNKYELIENEIGQTKLNYFNNPNGILPEKHETQKECGIRVVRGLEDFVFNIHKDAEIQKNVFVIVSHAQPINQMNIYLGYPNPVGWDNIKFCNCYVYEYEVNISNDNLRGKYVDSFFPEQ